jgi:hypothetical protein
MAQEAEAEMENVYVEVDGAAVQVAAALAAEACGLEEAAVLETAAERLKESGLDLSTMQPAGAEAEAPEAGDPAPAAEETETASDGEGAALPDESNLTVTTAQGTADPSTAEPGDEMLPLAVCRIDVERAAELGIPQANEIVTD